MPEPVIAARWVHLQTEMEKAHAVQWKITSESLSQRMARQRSPISRAVGKLIVVKSLVPTVCQRRRLFSY